MADGGATGYRGGKVERWLRQGGKVETYQCVKVGKYEGGKVGSGWGAQLIVEKFKGRKVDNWKEWRVPNCRSDWPSGL